MTKYKDLENKIKVLEERISEMSNGKIELEYRISDCRAKIEEKQQFIENLERENTNNAGLLLYNKGFQLNSNAPLGLLV